MNTPLSRSLVSIATLIVLAVLFFSVNILANSMFRSARIDLTENSLFTLSDGTKSILAHIDEPISLRFFYSGALTQNYPQIRAYADRVRNMLEEMRDRSNGKILLEVIDPEPFSEEEDRAVALGLKGAPTTEGEIVYFGLVGTNLVDGLETIPFFINEREQYLEYDLARMISVLSTPEKPVLGIVSNLPLDAGAGGMMAAMRGQSQSFMIYEELQDRFDVEFLEQDFVTVPHNINVLLIAHPKPLDDRTLYAIDQFVLRGGRVFAFIDPHSEVSLTAGPNGQPVQGYTEASMLEPLMMQWGVRMDPTKVIGDRGRAQRVRTGFDPRRPYSDYVLWLALQAGDMNQNDVVTADIDRLNLGTAGVLEPTENAATKFEPLIRSSMDAMLFDLDYVKPGPEPGEMLRNFKPTNQSYVIAARIAGPVKTAFPNGPPAEELATDGPVAGSPKPEDHLAESQGDATIILVADSDIFDDRFWVQVQNYLGEQVAVPIADNGKFILSGVENLMGSNDLISLRARERADRPFIVVEALRREAEARFLAEQDALQAKIADIEARLAELQAKADASVDGVVLSSEQERQETTRFREELVESRKALREVQRNLRRDIDTLAARVRFANVLGMPILVILGGVGFAVGRQRQRKVRMQAAKRAHQQGGT